MTDLTGQSLGRYHILEQLGEGGMAIVYKAYDTRLESDVAVKVIRTENLAPSILERALKRFEREAKALAKLTHANIVKVLDYGEHEGKPYLVMPYLPGGTLKALLKGKPIPWADAVRWLIPITRALAYAHSEGMIHRDVKPSNILITKTGDPMLTDFGIAKIIDEEMTVDLTGTSAAVGTPEYMAPEQVTSKNVDHRVDIYALGIVFYEMVTGHKPYVADTPMAVLFKHASEPLPRPKSFVPALPDAVERILIKALAKRKEDRYQNMEELATAFEQLLSGRQPTQFAAVVNGSTTTDTQSVDLSTRQQTTSSRTNIQNESIPDEQHRSDKRLTWSQAIGIGVGLAGLLLLLGLFLFKIPGLQGIFGADVLPTLTNTAVVVYEPPTLTPVILTVLPASDTPPPTDTPIPPTPTLVYPGYPLENCQTSSQDICLYSSTPQPDRLIVAFKYKSGIDSSRYPYLSIGNYTLECKFWDGYPGRLYCESTSPIPAGNYRLTLRYSETENICTGHFQITDYVVSSSPKKPGSSGGGKYK
ncbi:MAG: serine/threonine protein kinase [Chloroflexota bacterium]